MRLSGFLVLILKYFKLRFLHEDKSASNSLVCYEVKI